MATRWNDFPETMLRQSCPLTAELLERRGDFIALAQIAWQDPNDEGLSFAFLARVSADSDPLLAAVAAFEAAMIRARHGAAAEVLVRWPAEPGETIRRLLGGESLDGILRGEYALVVKPT